MCILEKGARVRLKITKNHNKNNKAGPRAVLVMIKDEIRVGLTIPHVGSHCLPVRFGRCLHGNDQLYRVQSAVLGQDVYLDVVFPSLTDVDAP